MLCGYVSKAVSRDIRSAAFLHRLWISSQIASLQFLRCRPSSPALGWSVLRCVHANGNVEDGDLNEEDSLHSPGSGHRKCLSADPDTSGCVIREASGDVSERTQSLHDSIRKADCGNSNGMEVGNLLQHDEDHTRTIDEDDALARRIERRCLVRKQNISPDDEPRIRYVRYGDTFLLGLNGPVEFVKKIQKRISEFLRDKLGLEANFRLTHLGAGKVKFLGTVLQGVPTNTSPKSSKSLEKRRRVKHRLKQIATQRQQSIESRIEKLGKNILARQLKKGKKETGSYHEAGLQLAQTLKAAGVAAESNVLQETAKDIQQNSREILHRLGWSNLPPNVQQAFLQLDESLGSWMSSLEPPAAEKPAKDGEKDGEKGERDGEKRRSRREHTGSFNQFSIRIYAPIDELIQRLRNRGMVTEKKLLPIHVGPLSNLEDEEIVNWFSSVANGILDYYRCCDNFDEVRAIVDYHIRWSAIFTLAHKHKSSARKIIQKHSKDLRIVNGDGKIVAKYPNSVELRQLRREFLERNRFYKEDAYKIMAQRFVRYSRRNVRLSNS